MDPISVLQNRIAQLEAKLGSQGMGETQPGDHTIAENLLNSANQMKTVTANHPKLSEAAQRASELNNYSDPNFIDNVQQKEVKMHEVESAEPMIVRHCHCMHHCKKAHMHSNQQQHGTHQPQVVQHMPSQGQPQAMQQQAMQGHPQAMNQGQIPQQVPQTQMQQQMPPPGQNIQQVGHVLTPDQMHLMSETQHHAEQLQANAAELSSQAGELAQEVQHAVEQVGEGGAEVSATLAGLAERMETAEQRRARRNGLD